MKILIVSTLNERSGSCIVIENMMKALNNEGHIASLWAPSGEILTPDVIIPKGLFSSLLCFIKNRDVTAQYDKVVVYTIRGVFIHLVLRRSILYVHEINSKSNLKYRIVNFLINFNKSCLFVVNPEIRKKYPQCSVKSVGNIYDDVTNENLKMDGSVLMIGAFSLDKGVDTLKEIAINYPDIDFKFLTTLLVPDSKSRLEFEQYCSDLPSNLFVTTNQKLKSTLLTESSFLLSLSRLDESFGLVIFEAVQYSCYPLVFSNTGSRYLLGDYPFLPNDNCVDKFGFILETVKNKVDLAAIRADFVCRFGESKVVNEFICND